jgi:hypothetical protein
MEICDLKIGCSENSALGVTTVEKAAKLQNNEAGRYYLTSRCYLAVRIVSNTPSHPSWSRIKPTS